MRQLKEAIELKNVHELNDLMKRRKKLQIQAYRLIQKFKLIIN